MKKIKILFNPKRQHFLNRLEKRGGSYIFFLLSRVVDTKFSFTGQCLVWRFGRHTFLTEDDRLQTYIRN